MNKTSGIESRLTRRRLTALLAASPLAAHVTSPLQSPPPAAAPAPAREERIAKAAADVREISGRLAQTEVPMSVEPAFSFRA